MPASCSRVAVGARKKNHASCSLRARREALAQCARCARSEALRASWPRIAAYVRMGKSTPALRGLHSVRLRTYQPAVRAFQRAPERRTPRRPLAVRQTRGPRPVRRMRQSETLRDLLFARCRPCQTGNALANCSGIALRETEKLLATCLAAGAGVQNFMPAVRSAADAEALAQRDGCARAGRCVPPVRELPSVSDGQSACRLLGHCTAPDLGTARLLLARRSQRQNAKLHASCSQCASCSRSGIALARIGCQLPSGVFAHGLVDWAGRN